MAEGRRPREGLGVLRPALADVATQKFDVVVIGGGINGTGIAREAQRAGYRTLLVERIDFGAGTTSRATRLIHGGLRYLEHGEFALVYESLHEREVLVREAAHLVRPLRLLVPVYRGDERPPWKVRAGLALYDLFSLRKSLPRHRAMPSKALDVYEPGLSRDGLRAAYTFFDAQVEFPERIVAETLREFTDAGGVAMNHVAVIGIMSPGGVLRSLRLRDEMTGTTADVEMRVAVNAAGPWVDELMRGSDAERHEQLIGGTKGSHIVVDWPDGPKHALFVSAREDGRPFFIVPWYRYTLIGTTDLRYDADPSTAEATPDEIRYLVDECNRLFPSAPITREEILYSYSGVRPLPFQRDGKEGTITRSHMVIDHVKRGGPEGLLSVVGGKLTTYRSLSRSGLEAIRKRAEPSLPPVADGDTAHDKTAQTYATLEDDPLTLYGRRAEEVRALVAADPALGERICEHNPEILAQVAYAVEREHAVTLGDVLLRRLPVGWSRCAALDGAVRVAAVMASRLGWDDARRDAEAAAYEAELLRTLPRV